MTPTTSVPGVLARAKQAVHPSLVEAVESLAPNLRRVVSYHLGWTDADGMALDGDRGKGIRPALAMLSAEAAWADPSVGTPGGVAVELIHNFSLLHDDVIDCDTERRHRPTAWTVFGVGAAIIAGDALVALAYRSLSVVPDSVAAAAVSCLSDGTAGMINGQADDLAFETRREVTVEECMTMSAGKTGALLGCASSIGAVLAGAPVATIGALRDFGGHLGLAFQAVDDLLGIWGDPAVTGKPAGNDLRQRKKSMPVVAALSVGGAESDELRTLIASEQPLDPDQVERATTLVEACGGREWTSLRAKAHLDSALGSLETVRINPVAQRELADLAVFVVERDA